MNTQEIRDRINTIRDQVLEEREQLEDIENRFNMTKNQVLEKEGQLMDAELNDQRRRILAIKSELSILRYQLKVLRERHGARLAPFCILIGVLLFSGCTPY